MHQANERPKLISGSATYLFSNILVAAIPFALLPVLTRVLGPVGYGKVAMFQALVGAFAAVTGLSVQGAANRKYYDTQDRPHELANFIGSCILILLASSLATIVVVGVFRETLSSWTGLRESWVLTAVIASAGSIVMAVRLGQWQISRQAHKYGVFQVSQSLLLMLLALFLVVVLVMGAAGMILAQLWATVIFAALALYSLYSDGLVRLAWRPEQIAEALRFGVPLVPHMAGLFLLRAVDRFVVNHTLGLKDVGIYFVAVQLAMVMAIVFDAVNKAYVPWLYERLHRDRIDEKSRIVRWTYAYFGLALIAAGALTLLGKYLVPLFAGPGYEAAADVIGWLALGQAFSGMYLMVTNYIFYSKRTGLLSLSTICAGALNVALLVLLTRHFGIRGAGMAFALSMAVRFVATWAVAQRRHPMPWRRALSTNRPS